jgi:hypothetical protein
LSNYANALAVVLGFKETTIEYVRAPRAAGETKWNYWQLYKLAIEGIISFILFPLKIWSYVGASVAVGAFLYGGLIIIKTYIFGADTPGYP